MWFLVFVVVGGEASFSQISCYFWISLAYLEKLEIYFFSLCFIHLCYCIFSWKSAKTKEKEIFFVLIDKNRIYYIIYMKERENFRFKIIWNVNFMCEHFVFLIYLRIYLLSYCLFVCLLTLKYYKREKKVFFIKKIK